MAAPREHDPVLPILALFAREASALEWGIERASRAWGDVALRSEPFTFAATDYYASTMGSPLTKVLVAFARLFDPAELPLRKRESNRWEVEYSQNHTSPVDRPLNLDPGYLTLAKLILATTKDRDHRIYLGHGIFAECTLAYHKGAWRNQRWTYPDYQLPEYHRFFDTARRYYREHR